VHSTGLNYIHISFRPHHPRDCDVIEFLKAMQNEENHPVYIHCYHGSDRTGMLCAIYRIFFQGWHKDKAIYEMIHGGYGFHLFFQHNLISYLKKLDVLAIREKAGLNSRS
jgi:protein-tyrosine phosphatase